jgi:hypothetical protein
MKFFDKCGFIFDESENKNYIGLSNISSFPVKKHFLTTYVLQNEQYRPDLISYRLFNNVNYAWVIDEMNNFYHGFKDYEAGKKIFYLKKEDLKSLGFIK